MGSFDFNCMLSGLPIMAGDPVRCLLLGQTPYEDSKDHHTCYSHGEWFPRTAPIRGTYDDYGFFDPAKSTKFEQSIWVKSFALDAAGIRAHQEETAFPKKFSFEDLHRALRDGTVLLHAETHESRASDNYRYEPPKGYPTPERVLETLKRAKIKGLKVLRLHNEVVSILPTGYTRGPEEVALLERAREALSGEYAVVIRGTNGYTPVGELLVFIKPGTPECHASEGKVDPKPDPPLRLSYALIHENVWQWFLAQSLEEVSYKGGKHKTWTSTPDTYKAQLRELYPAIQGVNGWAERFVIEHRQEGLLMSPVPFVVDVARLFGLVADMGKPVTHPGVAAFIDSMAELIFVWRVMIRMYRLWRPSHYQGQEAPFRQYEQFFRAMAEIAGASAQKQEEEAD